MIRIAVSFAALLLAGAAPSPPPAGKPVTTHPCEEAAAKYCKDVEYGGGQRIACLARHNADLTPACRERVKVLQAMFEFGQEQHRKTTAYLAKQQAEEAKKKSAPASKKPASETPANQTPANQTPAPH